MGCQVIVMLRCIFPGFCICFNLLSGIYRHHIQPVQFIFPFYFPKSVSYSTSKTGIINIDVYPPVVVREFFDCFLVLPDNISDRSHQVLTSSLCYDFQFPSGIAVDNRFIISETCHIDTENDIWQ